jgi:hypothetical protein
VGFEPQTGGGNTYYLTFLAINKLKSDIKLNKYEVYLIFFTG